MRSNHPRHVEIHLAVPADAAARREALEALLAGRAICPFSGGGNRRCRARSCWSEWR